MTTSKDERPVLFVDHTAELGGGELALLRLVRRTRLPASVLLLEDGPLASALREEGRDVTVLPAGSRWRRLRGLRDMLRAARRDGVTVVANSLRAATFVALLRPRGLTWGIFVRDGVDGQSLSRAKRLIFRAAAWRSSFLLANSQWTKGTIASLTGRDCRVVYTVSGIDGISADGRTPREVGSPLNVIFIGRLVEWKGPHLAIRACAEASRRGAKVRLAVCGSAIFGDDSYEERLRAEAMAAPLEVTFTGQVDVEPYLADSDLLVHTSTRPEPFGQIIVQALAAGRAVAAPDAGGPSEILGTCEESLLYPLGDVGALADIILQSFRDPEGLRASAAATAHRAKPFLDASMAEVFDDVISSL